MQRCTSVYISALRAAAFLLIGFLCLPLDAVGQTFNAPGFVSELVTNLPPFTPVGLAWAPDGRMFIWTKNGIVRVFKNGSLLPTPFIDLSAKVNTADDRGMWGLAFSPNFGVNGYVYLSYVFENGTNTQDSQPKTSRLTRVTADPNNPDVSLPNSEVVLLGSLGTPPCSLYPATADCIPADSGTHDIGTLRFAPDGKLFVGNGDGASASFADPESFRAQNLDSLSGKILRINEDGSAPGDNPFDDGTNSNRSRVWAYGLRNPYRFSLHPTTNVPYMGDVGWNLREEFNKGVRGANYGWPCFEGDIAQQEYQAAFVQCQQMSPASVTFPFYSYSHSSGTAAIGGPIYTGTEYPETYRGNFFFADYSGNWIIRAILDANGNPTSFVNFATNVPAPVSLEQGPDGLIYYVSITTGQIRRIRYNGPAAVANVAPSAGYSPLPVSFSSAGSIDPGGGALTYHWDFGDGASSNAPNPTHTYTAAGVVTYTATLTVTTTLGATSSATVKVTLGSQKPVAVITVPTDGTSYAPGANVAYQGLATDPDDGILPASAYSWLVLLHHNEHLHTHLTNDGVTAGSFIAADHGAGSYSYEIVLTVTDSSGLTATTSVLLPLSADTTPPTNPTGLSATTISSGQINLTWTASTDNGVVTGYRVERCQGAGCSNFVQVGTAPLPIYNDLGLMPSTTYSYRVRATDAGGNFSGYSNVASATTNAAPPSDTTPPTTPAGLTTTAVSSSQINMSWTGSTDNIAVTGYRVERCQGAGCSNFLQVATSTSTSYNDTGLLPVTSYSYRVLASDAAGNLSGYSNISTATTLAPPPGTGLVAAYSFDEGSGTTVIDASGNGNTGTINGAAWSTQGRYGNALNFDGINDMVVINSSASLNLSTAMTLEAWINPTATQSGWRTIMQREVDTYFLNASSDAGPLYPAGGAVIGTVSYVTGTAGSPVNSWTHVALTYNGTTLQLYVNGNPVASMPRTGPIQTSANPLRIGGNVPYGEFFNGRIDEVRVYNRALTQGEILADINTSISAPDTVPPTAPSGLGATTASSSQINLIWTASTDNVGVTAYRVERCQGAGCSNFAQVALPTGTTYNDPGLAASTSYSYRVLAADGAGNLSGYSNTASATTNAAPPPDTIPPTAPSGLSATAASTSQIDLSWTASTDNVAVTGYRVERCQGAGCSNFVQVATPAGTTHNDTGLSASASYSYRVLATDGAGNLSGYSNTASATTFTPPPATGLVAAYSFDEGTGTTVVDSSGNGNTGTINGATWATQGKFGSTLSFDGVNDMVVIAGSASLNVTTGMTLEAWINPAVTQSGWRTIMQKESEAYHLNASWDGGPLWPAGGGVFGGSWRAAAATAPTPPSPVNTWTHVALTYNGATLQLYVNGNPVATTAQTGLIQTTGTPLRIGGNIPYGEYFNGRIDELRVYNRALTQTEILADMNTAVSAPDTDPPTAPSGLSATAASSSQINLTWTASTDNVGVTGYRVERCQGTGCVNFVQVATPSGTTYNDPGLSASTSYSYRVLATDGAGNLSGYSNVAGATTNAPPDTTPPTAPSGLSATAAGSSQIDLTWTASTDNVAVTGYRVERCQGAGCSNFAQIATPTGLSYSDPGLSAATSYSYRVLATDAAGNLSGYSNVSSATTPDTTAPTAPSGLAATAASETQINLTWTASTDNVGVTGYRVERCQGAGCSNFAQVATPTGTTYNDPGLSAGTSYSYRVLATDAAGNLSGYSNVSSATTPDTTAPTAPSGLAATAASETQINLTWTASTDNVGVTGYRVERCQGAGCSNFAQIATPTGLSYSDPGRSAATSYSYRVLATDGAGNLSGYSNVSSATTPDTTAPTAPSGLAATAASESQINLSWAASTDNVGVTGYRVERCQGAGCSNFTQIATPAGLTYSDPGLSAGTSYSYRVLATDGAGNLSGYSNVSSATTPDTTAPTAPSGLAATAASETQINLTWTAATDNVGVTGYRVERCQGAGCSNFAQIATPTGLSYSDPGLSAATSYSYRVLATDAAGNLSGYSNVSSATTPDTTPPTAPSGLAATAASETQINLTWTASTDIVGVTGYRVERCQGASCSNFAQIATPTGPSYSDPGLSAATSYSYRVLATDAAGNLSGYSNVSSATTPDTTAPTAPSGLSATAASQSQINLTWTASTDNVGVTGYRVERCQGAGCSNFAQIATPSGTTYSDPGLSAGTSYSYRVLATDAAGNLSGYSNVSSATTPDTTAPTAPSGLSATAASESQINLTWTASTDNVGVTGYRVERCQGAGCSNFAQIATPTGLSYSDPGLSAATSYSYRVLATDAAGNLSGYSNVSSATTPDTTSPTAPSGLSATAASTTQINLTWAASTDNVGVTGYRVERCQGAGCSNFVQIATPAGASYNDPGLLESTTYNYRVLATDAAGNLSGYSNVAGATTLTPPDTTPPTAPSGLSATAASTSQINLTWTASTDNIGVTGYRVERCQGAGCSNFAQIATPTGPSYSDPGLSAATSYSYRVLATDAAGNLSGYSNVSSATTPDTAPPTAPSGLSATAASTSQINLTWTASTDNVGVTGYRVERCEGAGCSNFAQVATPSGTAYNDPGLAASTTYNYRVLATDAAGNLSGYSNIAGATTLTPPDTTPPTAPSGLSATAASTTQINLSWTASTDNVGVTGYRVERCQGAGCSSFVQIATPVGTTYNDPGLSPSTTYNYRVRATDAAANLSGYSNVAGATTLTPPDTTPPTAPSGLSATAVSTSQINLSWTASTDNVGVTGYRVERCQGAGCSNFAQVATPAGTTYNDPGLSASTSYSYRVRATDAAGNLGGYSNVAGATTLSPSTGLVAAYSFDEGAGTTVTDSSGNGNTGTINGAAWTTSGKYGRALNFDGINDMVVINSAASLNVTTAMTLEAWINPTATQSGWRTIMQKEVESYHINASWDGGPLWPAGGGVFGGAFAYVGAAAPTPPSPVNAWTHVALTYNGSTLQLYVNGNPVASQARTGTIQTNSNPLRIGGNVPYGEYFNGRIDEVRIYNRALSQAEILTDINTSIAPPDTIAPTAPSGLSATPASSQINLSWSASTDNIGVTGYRVERCQGAGCSNFAQVATPSGTTYNDTGLAVSTSYSYRVLATDLAGNLSGYSNTASATTNAGPPPDTTPPTAPTGLSATAASTSQINLTWTAATDNVAVTGYRVERCQGAGCSNFAQVATPSGTSYNDPGLGAATSYSYRVRATDGAGNLSGYSNTASATTLTPPPATGLVAAYSFNEGTGTTVTDSSGNGNTGTINGATWTTLGKYGNTLSFDGVNNMVVINSSASLNVTTGMTLEAWIYPTATQSGWRTIMQKEVESYHLNASWDGGPLWPAGGGVFGGSFGYVGAAAPTPPSPVNTWTHVALTYNGSTLQLYVNGNPVASQARTGAIQTNSNPLRIGGNVPYGEFFNGRIDELRVYNRALSQAEIQIDMNAPLN